MFLKHSWNKNIAYIPCISLRIRLCWLSLAYIPYISLKPRPNDRNMRTQHVATLLGATCCVRLATVLRCVAACWVLLAQIWKWSNLSQQHPTCRSTVAKRTQHVAPNNVATCCVGMLRSFGRGLRTRLCLGVSLGVRTCELFLCFVTVVRVRAIVLTSLFSLFYVTCEFHRFLHRGRAESREEFSDLHSIFRLRALRYWNHHNNILLLVQVFILQRCH